MAAAWRTTRRPAAGRTISPDYGDRLTAKTPFRPQINLAEDLADNVAGVVINLNRLPLAHADLRSAPQGRLPVTVLLGSPHGNAYGGRRSFHPRHRLTLPGVPAVRNRGGSVVTRTARQRQAPANPSKPPELRPKARRPVTDRVTRDRRAAAVSRGPTPVAASLTGWRWRRVP